MLKGGDLRHEFKKVDLFIFKLFFLGNFILVKNIFLIFAQKY